MHEKDERGKFWVEDLECIFLSLLIFSIVKKGQRLTVLQGESGQTAGFIAQACDVPIKEVT